MGLIGGIDQQRVQGVGILRCPQFVRNLPVAEQPGDSGKSLQMIGACTFRCEQKEDKINRLVVQSIEIDRLDKAREDASDRVNGSQLAMGDRYSVADTRGTQFLPLQDRVEDLSL